ncbi:unnamed protein product [Ilex paraguariensis]|uniref:RING-type domain-containing protein n=1 Tax=Ilex paraguariensis TaxID=185542 RepID=A0ABC8UFM4_9AQUA
MSVVLVFAALPVVSLLHEFAKSLRSPALLQFNSHHQYHDTVETTMVGEETIKEEDGLEEVRYCVVCLCQVCSGDRYRLLPQCNHKFHVHCIDTWLETHSTCPLCRSTIPKTSVPPRPLQQHHYSSINGLLCYPFSLFENMFKWLAKPPNPGLMSAVCEHCQYLPNS